MRNIIIPSAILVPKELQSIGKLPPVIYPINQKTVFDFLYAQYKNIAENFLISCYEESDKVYLRLNTYKDERIKIIKLSELQDLGHSIYEAMDDETTPVIINFADTIIMADIFNEDVDAFFYQEDYVTEQWTYFEEYNGAITKIIDKNGIFNEKKRLFAGVFQIMHPLDFKECMEMAFEETNNQISTFYRALVLYSKQHAMKPVYTDNWFDIGHLDKYYSSLLEVKAREFNHITIDKQRGILRKTSSDKEKFIGEILWYLKLPHDIEYVRPRIFQYSIDYENPYIEMEYYSYHTLHELYLYSDLTIGQWKTIFERIKFFCDDLSKYTVKDIYVRESLEEMYLNKTKARLNSLRENENFSKFFTNSFYVNGIKYKTFSSIIRKLEDIINELYDIDTFSIIHGDLCFTNILVDSNFNFIKVIDPRGKFGHYDIYGDKRYEIAKLFHSIDGGYDFIIKDLFDLNFDSNRLSIEYKIQNRTRNFDLFEMFLSVFEDDVGNDKEKIELIEALLFFSMIPLHKESVRHQFAMLATGIIILDRLTDIREKS